LAIYLTSDLHADHKNICKYTKRGLFTSQEDHAEWIADIWNSTVKPGDTVYSLGDFMFTSKAERIIEYIAGLSGVKHFITGNHCNSRAWAHIRKTRVDDPRLGSVALVDKLHRCHFEVEGTKQMFVMCHFPLAVWENQHYGSWHLHGHSHGTYQGAGKSLDVGLDMAYKLYGEHRFFSLDDVIEFMSTREVVSNDYHGEEDRED